MEFRDSTRVLFHGYAFSLSNLEDHDAQCKFRRGSKLQPRVPCCCSLLRRLSRPPFRWVSTQRQLVSSVVWVVVLLKLMQPWVRIVPSSTGIVEYSISYFPPGFCTCMKTAEITRHKQAAAGIKPPSTWAVFADIWRREGIRGINKGVNAVAVRQCTNWGSR